MTSVTRTPAPPISSSSKRSKSAKFQGDVGSGDQLPSGCVTQEHFTAMYWPFCGQHFRCCNRKRSRAARLRAIRLCSDLASAFFNTPQRRQTLSLAVLTDSVPVGCTIRVPCCTGLSVEEGPEVIAWDMPFRETSTVIKCQGAGNGLKSRAANNAKKNWPVWHTLSVSIDVHNQRVFCN